MSRNWPTVFNLVNSVIGVSVLAMPFCFHRCGVILGALAMLLSGSLTKKTCELLLRGAHLARKGSYEALALHSFGRKGKVLVEASIIGLLCGTLVAFQAIIGDLAPDIVHKMTGIEQSSSLRAIVMVSLATLVGLPLSLMRNLQSLAALSGLSLLFYLCFVVQIFFKSLHNLLDGSWMNQVHLWKWEGLLHCLPIFAMAYACQTQLFVLYESLPEPSVKKMESVVDTALNLVSVAYLGVGVFGYICFYDVGVKGDILTNFPSSFTIDLMKFGFMMSVLVSFPLMVYPMRSSLHSLMFMQQRSGPEGMSTPEFIPHNRFVYLTTGIVSLTLFIGIMIPEIEFILGLNGATMGSLIAFIYPAAMFLHIVQEKSVSRLVAKAVLAAGVICLVMSTFTVLTTAEEPHGTDIHPPGVDPIKPVGGFPPVNVTKLPIGPVASPREDADAQQVVRTALPNPPQIGDPKPNAAGVERREEPPIPQDPDVKPKAPGDPQVGGLGADSQRQLKSERHAEEEQQRKPAAIEAPAVKKEEKITDEDVNKELKRLEDEVPGTLSVKSGNVGQEGKNIGDSRAVLQAGKEDDVVQKKVKRDLVEVQQEVATPSSSQPEQTAAGGAAGAAATVATPEAARSQNYSSVSVKARDLKQQTSSRLRSLLSKKRSRSKRSVGSKAR